MEDRADIKAQQVMKRRTKEYVRDTLLIILAVAIVVTGVVLAIKFLSKPPASIVLYDENGEAIGTYSEKNTIPVPEKKGYSSSWVADDGTTYDTIEAALSNGVSSIKQVFTPIEYTVTLYLVGGALNEAQGFESHEVIEGQEELGVYYTKTFTVKDDVFELPAVKEKTIATKRGCDFAFWSTVNYIGTSFDAGKLTATEIKNVYPNDAHSVVLYAVWKDIISTIHVFDKKGELMFYEEHKFTSKLSEEELTATVLENAPAGYDFAGFYKDSHFNEEYDFESEIEVLVLPIYTKWNAKSFLLTFKDTDGETLSSTTYKTDAAISFYDYTSRLAPGMSFKCWLLDNKPFPTDSVMPAKDIVLYPKCAYIITWQDKDGNEVYSTTADSGEVIDLNLGREHVDDSYTESTRTYSFKGWSVGNIFQNSNNYTVVGVTVIQAKYEDDSDKFNYILLDENDEEIVHDTYYVGEYEDLYTLIMGIVRSKPSTDMYSYTFDGWYYDKAGVQTKLTEATKGDLDLTKDETITLKEKFISVLKQYTYTFYLDDGVTPYVQETKDYGTIVNKPADPTKAATVQNTYTFIGWTTLNGDPYVDGQELVRDVAYKANFSSSTRQYTYSFFMDDETTPVLQETVDYGTIVYKPTENPTKATTVQYTYEFAGWTTFGGVDYVDGQELVSDVSYKANFTPTVRKYTYSFFMDDETTPVLQATEDYGTIVNAPADPTKTATAQYTYAFAGWTTFNGDAYVDGQELVGDVAYKASFTPSLRSYTYKFYVDSDPTKTETIDYDEEIIAPADPSKAETAQYTYTFVGWFEDVNDSSTAFVTGKKIDSNISYYAKFSATVRQYTYTFYNESAVFVTDTVDYGTEINFDNIGPASKINPDQLYAYTFLGWYNDSDCFGDPRTGIVAIVGPAEYYAGYNKTAIEYNITYSLPDGSSTTNIATYSIETPAADLALSDPTAIAGYTFTGWKYNNEGIDSIDDTGVYANITIVGCFEANEYTITFDPVKTGATATPTNKVVTYDEAYGTLATASVHGYDFVGWYLDSNYDEQTKITSSSIVSITSNTTVYAKWALHTYYVHGYVGSTKVAEFEFDIETPVNLSAYTKDGEYEFGGWYLEDVTDESIAASSFTSVSSYSDTTGAEITCVYAIVKTNGLTISGNAVTAYDNTKTYTNIIIPRVWESTEITTINANVFKKNSTITTVETKFITTIGDQAFYRCTNLSNIDLSNVTSVGEQAFANCKALTSVDLSSATSIGEEAFSNSGVIEITLSKDLVTIGDYAFFGCNITTLNFNGTKSELEAILDGTEGNEDLLNLID